MDSKLGREVAGHRDSSWGGWRELRAPLRTLRPRAVTRRTFVGCFVARPGAQANIAESAIRVAVDRSAGPVAGIGRVLPPLARRDAEPALEGGVEKAEVVEPALHGHVDDLGIRIPQQRNGLEESQFYPEVGD